MSEFDETINKMVTDVTKAEETEISNEKSHGGVQETVKSRIFLKALPLRTLEDVDMIKQEVKSGNILILKISPLARKSVEDVKMAVTELVEFARSIGGDIARLGEERVVITPPFVIIWREKINQPQNTLTTTV